MRLAAQVKAGFYPVSKDHLEMVLEKCVPKTHAETRQKWYDWLETEYQKPEYKDDADAQKVLGNLKAKLYHLVDLTEYQEFSLPDTRVTVGDVCAGEGKALRQIADHFQCPDERVVGCELAVNRSEALRKEFPDGNLLLGTDATTIFMRAQSLSFLWLNPPFDDEFGGGRQGVHVPTAMQELLGC